MGRYGMNILRNMEQTIGAPWFRLTAVGTAFNAVVTDAALE